MKVLIVMVASPEVGTDVDVQYPILAPPLTSLLLSEICVQANHEVELTDTRYFQNASNGKWIFNEYLFTKTVQESPAQVILLSFLSSMSDLGRKIASICKALGKTVVVGGVHASICPEEFVTSSHFDLVVTGEAEEILPYLLKTVEKHGVSKFETKLVNAGCIANMSIIPPITHYDLYEKVFSQYLEFRTMYVEIIRGCNGSCTYCEISRSGSLWKPIRKIPFETIKQNISTAIKKFDVNYIVVTDSNATLSPEYFNTLIQFLKDEYPHVSLQLNSVINQFKEEYAQKCNGLSCSVWFGFESASPRIQKILGKSISKDKAKLTAKICEDNGIKCAFNLILGLDGEEEEDYEQTVELIAECPSLYPNPNIFNPLPGTLLYKQYEKSGLLSNPGDYKIWDINRIQREQTGPVKCVNYDTVSKYYNILVKMQNERSK